MYDRTNSRRTCGWTLRSGRAALAALAALCLLAAPAQAEDRFEDLGPNSFDVLVLRPFTLLQVGVGAILFLPTAALTAGLGYVVTVPYTGFDFAQAGVTAKGNFDEAVDVFVREPYERAVTRPLGAW